MRQLVKYWKRSGHLTLLYLDRDGLGGDRAFTLNIKVRQDRASSGFTSNDEKSCWVPVLKLTSLGSVLHFDLRMFFFIPEYHTLKLKFLGVAI